MRRWAAPGALLLALAAAGPVAADDLQLARKWAKDGRRTAAITLLRQKLAGHPADGDARVLLGIYLSWEGPDHYVEARALLRGVLAEHPVHGDALPALMNLEMWDGHPERAEDLGRTATGPEAPAQPAVLVARARALAALNRVHDALPLVDRALAAAPQDEGALALRSRLTARARAFEVGTTTRLDWFDDGTRWWHEHALSLKRETVVGPFLARLSRAYRFGDEDDLFEAEAYPRLRAGTYAYLDAGIARRHTLYPKLRLGADLYQALGLGFEASVGVRHLRFVTPTNVFVAALGKYWGRWLFIGRGYVTPGQGRTSLSGHAIARWYFGGEGTSYLGLRYAHGLAREPRTSGDTAILDSDAVAADATAWIARRLLLYAEAVLSRDERGQGRPVRQLSTTFGIAWRF